MNNTEQSIAEELELLGIKEYELPEENNQNNS